MLDALQNGKPARIRVLSCVDHHSLDTGRGSCAVYSDDFVQYLTNTLSPRPTYVHLKCGSLAEDFADMVRAPLLVSSGSSMSSMAAFGRPPNTTVLPSLYLDGFYYPGILHIGMNSRSVHLPHSEVVNYFDTDTVKRQLRQHVNVSDLPTIEIVKEWQRDRDSHRKKNRLT